MSSNFSSVFDEFITNLNPQEKNIWDRMNKAWNTSKTTQMLKDQLQNSLLITGRILKQESNKLQLLLTSIAAAFTAIGAISFVEIAQSEGLDWKFYIDFWNFEIGEWVSNPINLFGSILAVLFALAFVFGIFVLVIWLIIWLRDCLKARRSRNNNKDATQPRSQR